MTFSCPLLINETYVHGLFIGKSVLLKKKTMLGQCLGDKCMAWQGEGKCSRFNPLQENVEKKE